MQFLVIADIRTDPGFKAENFADLLKQEVESAVAGYLDGSLRQLWLQDPNGGAVALIEAGTITEANSIIAQWPLQKAGWLDARLIALKPFPGFGRH